MDRLEILPVSLLIDERPRVRALQRLARRLNLEFGWHYLLDLTWILRHLGNVDGKSIMDAGAGTGILQWYLADKAAEVISVDRVSRAHLPGRFRQQFQVEGLRPTDLLNGDRLGGRTDQDNPHLAKGVGKRLVGSVRDGIRSLFVRRSSRGWVRIYNQELSNLTDISSDSLDAVAAVSALEHNEPDYLKIVIKELLRVLKPGGMLIATLAAARDRDWFHEPSKGWCYTEASLRRIFELPPSVPSNFHLYDRLFAELCACHELRDNLAKFYFKSGDNGMPWGIWDPQYQPVGVIKIKR